MKTLFRPLEICDNSAQLTQFTFILYNIFASTPNRKTRSPGANDVKELLYKRSISKCKAS